MPHAAKFFALIAATATLAGCTTGGFGGGTANLAPVSAGVVALGGGLIGEAKGLKLPADARAKALEAEFQALQFTPAGQEVPWTSEGWQGSVVPTQLYRIGSQDCRGYSHTVIAGGQALKQIGTACKTEDGYWTPVV